MTENTPYSTPALTPESRDQAPVVPATISNDCDTNIRDNHNEEDDVVCANETVPRNEQTENNETEQATSVDNAQDNQSINDNRNSSQETVESEVNETENEVRPTNEVVNESNGVDESEDRDFDRDDRDDDARTEIEEITFGRERTITEETGDDSTESLTFDENHFSTPTGGVTPERRQSTARRRRTTASSLDSEVRLARLRA